MRPQLFLLALALASPAFADTQEIASETIGTVGIRPIEFDEIDGSSPQLMRTEFEGVEYRADSGYTYQRRCFITREIPPGEPLRISSGRQLKFVWVEGGLFSSRRLEIQDAQNSSVLGVLECEKGERTDNSDYIWRPNHSPETISKALGVNFPQSQRRGFREASFPSEEESAPSTQSTQAI